MKTVLITGASSGIGKSLASLFAANGYNLVLVARREDILQGIAAELGKRYHVQVQVMCQDLALPHAADMLYKQLGDQKIAVDILVNNAGFGDYGAFDATDMQKNNSLLLVNIIALTELSRLLLPHMKKRGFGKILNVASTAAFQPGPYMAVYFASKSYVLSFSEALSEELKGSTVTVSTLCPGPTKTEFEQQASKESLFMFKDPMPVERVAQAAYDGLMANKVIIIPGMKNTLFVFLLRLLPRRIIRKTMATFLKKT